jgi:pimeloyl-ACP methyl ester carboxylesterase
MSPGQIRTAAGSRPGGDFVSGTVESHGYTLDYAWAGPKHPEATIVSLPGSAGMEMSTAKDLLIGRYRVIEVNPPGWGARDDIDTHMHQSELGPILAEAIGQLVDGPFFIIGTSMGGTNALYVAAELPQRVQGIILEGSMVPSRPADLHMPPPTPGDEGATEVSYPEPVVDPRKPWATPEYVAQQMATRMRMFHWIEPAMDAPAAVAAVRASRVPVLGLLGDDDEILAPTQELRFREEFPGADFQLVPTGRHDLQNTVPAAFVYLVSDFIASVTSTS